jgi:hypothetical protein
MPSIHARLALLGSAASYLVLALACGKGSDTAPPEAPEGTWRDSECGLVWQQELAGSDYQAGAIATCEGLDLGGLTWRLPTIGELRCLVNGCQDTALDGDCEVDDECAGVGCLTTACDGCGEAGGEISCYWSSQLGTTCDDPLWSSTAVTDEAAWVLHFRDGSISHDEITEHHYLRCVSDG